MAKRKLISAPVSYKGLKILSIISPLRDYKLAYFINRDTSLNLVRKDDLPVFGEKDGKIITYPFFSFADTSQRVHYYLIGNNHTGGKMCPDLKQADFLLFMISQYETAPSDDLFNIIKAINGVQLVQNADPDRIKNLEGLMSDLELHMVGIK